MANMATPKQNITRLAPVTARERNRRRGTSGWSASVASMTAKAANSTTAMAPVMSVERRGPRHLVGVDDGVHQGQQPGGHGDRPRTCPGARRGPSALDSARNRRANG